MPADNPVTEEKVALGRRLFYDARLSGNGTQACASCHEQRRAFTDGRPRAVGSTGETHPRGAMSLANVAYAASLTWADPSTTRLEEQSLEPLMGEHPVEMGVAGHEDEVLARLRGDPIYAELFRVAFPGDGDAVTLESVRKAIASFERTILSGDSPYDRLVWKDDRGAMSPGARRGMALFFSERLACSKCHAGFTFSGPIQWVGGPAARPALENNGLGGRYRVPTLRNIAVTAPYMHDGRFATLDPVIDHYAQGGDRSPDRSALVKGFTVTTQEKADLIAFLESLTDDRFLSDPLYADPWTSGPQPPHTPVLPLARPLHGR